MDTIHRFVFEHRRLLAAGFTGLAVLAALGSLRQTPDGARVLVAGRDLPSGHVVRAADVRTALLPEASRPSHTLDRAAVVGRRVAGPMRKGEVLTDYRVLRPDALAGYGRNAVLTTVRVAEADGLTAVHVGDRVDVIAVDPAGETAARVVARDLEVVTVPSAETSEAIPLGIVTTEKVALALATAALESRFSVITSSS
jgi:Flp pilus assembly protein CpaB